jgi:hypothetical protein
MKKMNIRKIFFAPKVLLIVFVIIQFGFSFKSSIAYGSIIFVGSEESYKTIQAGIDASSDFDTVIVKDGEYTGYNKMNYPAASSGVSNA